MQSLQMIKEQLKIKTVELRKANEEKGKVRTKIKDLITFNQVEVKKLKEVAKKSEEEVLEQKSLLEAARLSKHAGVEAVLKEKKAEITKRIESKLYQKSKDKMKKLAGRIESLRKRVEMRNRAIKNLAESVMFC